MQSGWTPPVMRQYDAVEAQRSFAAHAKPDAGILILVHEGPATRVRITSYNVCYTKLLRIAGLDALSRNGLRYPIATYGVNNDARAGMGVSYGNR